MNTGESHRSLKRLTGPKIEMLFGVYDNPSEQKTGNTDQFPITSVVSRAAGASFLGRNTIS